MRTLALLSILLFAPALRADDNSCGLGIKLPDAFSGCEILDGALHLKAQDAYLDKKKTERAGIVLPVLEAEKNSLSKNILTVDYKGGGELWTLDEKGGAKLLDKWSVMGITVGENMRKSGRIFGFIGGQLMRGGDYPSQGFTARLGTTLLQERYDASIGYSHNAYQNVDDSGTNSLSLAARALFRYSKHIGFNAGGQLDRVSYTGYSDWTPSLLGGVNFYTSNGSIDFMLNYGESGNKSLQFGYTFFMTRE
jgi:hypothetical protein